MVNLSFLPNIPRLSTIRSKVADAVFVLLLLVSRFCFLIGAIVGAKNYGFKGFLIGLIGGAALGFWMRRSLGVRGRNLTQGYHLRMYERGCGKHPGTLESFIEMLRGTRLSMMQCRLIACAFAEAARAIQSCDSTQEEAAILQKRDRKILEIAYGERAIAKRSAAEEVPNPA